MKKSYTLFMILLFILLLTSCNVNSYSYHNSDKYISNSNFTIESEIIEINVSWLNGNVKIIEENTSSTSVKEDNCNDFPLYYYLNGSTLNIEFVKSGTNNKKINSLNKELIITLPKSTIINRNINIDIVNGNCSFINECNFKNIEVNIVNGTVSTNSINANNIEIELVNGNITIDSLSANNLKVEKVNGYLTINNIQKQATIDIESVNGTDTVYVSETLGYIVNYDALGKFKSDYDDMLEFGNKLVEIEYDAVNGSLHIKK